MKMPPLKTNNPASLTPNDQAAPAPAAKTVTAHKKPVAEPDMVELAKLAEKLSTQIGTAGQQIQFAVDTVSGKAIMQIIDIQTNTVLRQVPGDEAMAMARAIDSMQGMLIRQKA